MKTEELEQVLREFGINWGDCGLNWNENDKPVGYLYPIDESRGNCTDAEVGPKYVAELLSEANDYVIRDDGYIDILL